MLAALFALICLIWGSTWLAIKIGLDGVPPFLGAGLRFVLAGAIIGAILLAKRTPVRLTRHDKICVLSLGILLFWFDYAAVYWAETIISSGLTAVLFSTMPLVTALLSAFWTRSEPLSRRKIFGTLIGVVGTVLLFWPREQLAPWAALGMLAALAGSTCAAVNLVMMKKYGRDSDPLVLNTLGMALGAACLLGMSAVFEDWSGIVWTQANVLAMLYLSIVGSVVAFSAYLYLIKHVAATVVSLSALITPIVALVLGRLILGETMSPLAVAGIVTVLAGVAVAILPTRG